MYAANISSIPAEYATVIPTWVKVEEVGSRFAPRLTRGM